MFRLLLAAAVVLSHISRFDIGRLAVLLFFYLSGYWVTAAWAQKFNSSDIGRFYAARYLRIAPLFLLATVGAALLLHHPLHLVNATLLGLASTDSDPTGVSWSLDIELQFYLLLPFVAWAVAWAAAGRRRWLMAAALAALAAAGWYAESRFQIRTVAKYLPAFALGVMTYAYAWRPSLRAANLSLLGFIAMTALTALTPFLDKTDAKPFDQDIWSFVWMLPLLPYVARSLTIRSTRLDREFGNLSFPLYLVHFPIIAFATATFGYGLGVKLGAAVVAVAFAIAVLLLIDRPLDALRVRLTEGQATRLRTAPRAP